MKNSSRGRNTGGGHLSITARLPPAKMRPGRRRPSELVTVWLPPQTRTLRLRGADGLLKGPIAKS